MRKSYSKMEESNYPSHTPNMSRETPEGGGVHDQVAERLLINLFP